MALRVWPEAPRHSNQVLRYWRGMRLDHARAMPPHRAGPDAWVTAHILADLAQLHQKFGDEAISFEDYEPAKSELLAQLAVE